MSFKGPIGIFAKTFLPATLTEVFEKLQQLQVTQTHFNMQCAGLEAMPERISPLIIEDIRQQCIRYDVEIIGISGTYNMIHPDFKIRKQGLNKLGVLAAACSALGTQLISLCTGSRDPHDKWRFHPDNSSTSAWLDLLVEMEKAILLAEQYDLFLGIEPELANVVSSCQSAHRLIQEMQSDRLKIIFDAANLFEKGDIQEIKTGIQSGLDLLAAHLIMAHAKDRDSAGRVVPAGKGIIPFHFYLEALAKVGFDGPLIAHGLAQTEAAEALDFLRAQASL